LRLFALDLERFCELKPNQFPPKNDVRLPVKAAPAVPAPAPARTDGCAFAAARETTD